MSMSSSSNGKKISVPRKRRSCTKHTTGKSQSNASFSSASSIITDSNSQLRSVDVCCGRGKGSAKHPGNVLFQRLIQENASNYANARSKSEKSQVVASIVGAIYATGGRFMKSEYGEYVDIGKVKAHEKTGHSVRDHILHRQKRGKPLTPPAPSAVSSTVVKKASIIAVSSPSKSSAIPKKNSGRAPKSATKKRTSTARRNAVAQTQPQQSRPFSPDALKAADSQLAAFENFYHSSARKSSAAIFDFHQSQHVPPIPISSESSFLDDKIDATFGIFETEQDLAEACKILSDDEEEEKQKQQVGTVKEKKYDLKSVFDTTPRSSVCWPVSSVPPQPEPLAATSILPEDWL